MGKNKESGEPMVPKGVLIEQEDVGDADGLIEILRPSHGYWDGPGRNWAFRGQANACWQLMPTAFRVEWATFLPVNAISTKADELRAQQENEKTAFERFVELADRIGYYIPSTERLFHLNSDSDMEVFLSQNKWPPPELIEPLAVARHHGVPARLLDITMNPMVAAFFAANAAFSIQSATSEGRPASFAVWAINLAFLKYAWRPYQERVKLVRVPTGRNPFLNAQQGAFLIDLHANKVWPTTRSFQALDTILHERGSSDEAWDCVLNSGSFSKFCGPPVIRKFVVPLSEAGKVLMRLFYQEGLSMAHIMPTLDNVTKSLVDILRVKNSMDYP